MLEKQFVEKEFWPPGNQLVPGFLDFTSIRHPKKGTQTLRNPARFARRNVSFPKDYVGFPRDFRDLGGKGVPKTPNEE